MYCIYIALFQTRSHSKCFTIIALHSYIDCGVIHARQQASSVAVLVRGLAHGNLDKVRRSRGLKQQPSDCLTTCFLFSPLSPSLPVSGRQSAETRRDRVCHGFSGFIKALVCRHRSMRSNNALKVIL